MEPIAPTRHARPKQNETNKKNQGSPIKTIKSHDSILVPLLGRHVDHVLTVSEISLCTSMFTAKTKGKHEKDSESAFLCLVRIPKKPVI